MNIDMHYMLYANCVITKGYSRSIICDLINNSFEFIPNDLYLILDNYKHNTISEILSYYDRSSKNTIIEYFSFLLDNKFIYFCEERDLSLFSKLSLEWSSPYLIQDAVVEVRQNSDFYLKQTSDELKNLGCQYIQLKFVEKMTIDEIFMKIRLFLNQRIRGIELILEFNSSAIIKIFNNLELKAVLYSCIFYKAPHQRFYIRDNYTKIFYTKQDLTKSSHCGFVRPEYFNINIEFYVESQRFNNCLNRKVAIDRDGNIKNCLAMTKTYGKIGQNKINDIINGNDFTMIWEINKNKIDVCKDCEFRYICSDCRAFLLDNLRGKPAKCSYSPYKMIWEA